MANDDEARCPLKAFTTRLERDRAKRHRARREFAARLRLTLAECKASGAELANMSQDELRAKVRAAVAEHQEELRRAVQAASGDQVLRVAEVMKITGLSRATIWRLETAGKFPRRVQISENAVGWHAKEIAAWNTARPRR